MNTLASLKKSSAYFSYHALWIAIDWLYPPQCGGCGKLGIRWCSECQSKVVELKENLCELCGEVLPHSGICETCHSNPPAFKALRSVAAFSGPLRTAIHQLKYHQDIALAESLAELLFQRINALKWDFDIVTSVPLSKERQKERGYNQSNLLAIPLALRVRKPFIGKAVERIRATHSQVGLNKQERQENVRDAFRANPQLVDQKTVLIIDDVATTGATLRASSQALRNAGAIAVYGLTLARPVMSMDDSFDESEKTSNLEHGFGIQLKTTR
jgi:ComF family protein